MKTTTKISLIFLYGLFAVLIHSCSSSRKILKKYNSDPAVNQPYTKYSENLNYQVIFRPSIIGKLTKEKEGNIILNSNSGKVNVDVRLRISENESSGGEFFNNLRENLSSNQVISYYSFAFQNDLSIKVGNNQFSPKSYYFEQSFNITDFTNFYFSFELPRNELLNHDTVSLLVFNEPFETDTITINYPISNLGYYLKKKTL